MTKEASVVVRDAVIEHIAREQLWLTTLETRNSDQLDFHELSVGQLKRALEDAYEAGRRAG